jgi:2-polyprenyl-6-methoxyphenol hydroxylase-like FAD-dependent oxidoreductase
MIQIYEKNYVQFCFSLLTNKNINTHNIESAIFLNHQNAKKLHDKIDFDINTLALRCSLCFKIFIKLAVISGAGIAGLCISFELLAKGYKVIIAEKREAFSRSNIINFNIEIQHFLKRFHLLKEFEESVAAKIKSHKVIHIGKDGAKELFFSDVSNLKLSNQPFEIKNFNNLFKEDGVYSAKIKDLQAFLASKALENGVQIFGNVKVSVQSLGQVKGSLKVEIIANRYLQNPIKLKPDLLFVAEGAHSTTAKSLNLKTKVVKNMCTDEHWIYGNINYPVEKSFVVSIVDTLQKKLSIANVIFNAKVKQINIAVTSKHSLSKNVIENKLLAVLKKVFSFESMEQTPTFSIATVDRPVRVRNKKRKIFSKGNVFLIGDSAGNSSPLAGLGGTICLTLIPKAVEQLLNDSEVDPSNKDKNFENFSNAYISRWMGKSDQVKGFCTNLFNQEQLKVGQYENQQ